jgi:hypothetical protein
MPSDRSRDGEKIIPEVVTITTALSTKNWGGGLAPVPE